MGLKCSHTLRYRQDDNPSGQGAQPHLERGENPERFVLPCPGIRNGLRTETECHNFTNNGALHCMQNISPMAILLITFTNKAAEELRHRLEEMGLPKVGDMHHDNYKYGLTNDRVVHVRR